MTTSEDCGKTCSFREWQEKIAGLYSSLLDLMNAKGFEEHIKTESTTIKDVNVDQLTTRRDDVLKTECSIVIAGETSSGKSTIINLIINDKVLPTKVTASTTRVCRLRFSETYSVSTVDKNNRVISTSECQNIQEIAKNLKKVATTNDPDIFYVDVFLPSPTIKGNVMIVDTPGIGDADQEDVAKMTLDYLRNALAVVFVVNVANAGGLQSDRLGRIIASIRNSMTQMVCFSPGDTIFVLNKWDAIIDAEREEFFESTKEKIKGIWREIDENRILKLCAGRAHETEDYEKMHTDFEQSLKAVINKNETKRIQIHLQFLKTFLKESEATVSSKIRNAEQEFARVIDDLRPVTNERYELTVSISEAETSLPHLIDKFIEVATERFHKYVHSDEFKKKIFEGTENWTKFRIENELMVRIDKGTIDWQEEHIENIFRETVLESLGQRFLVLDEALNLMLNKLPRQKIVYNFNKEVKNALFASLGTSSAGVTGGLVASSFLLSPPLAIGTAVVGLVGGAFLTGRSLFSDNFQGVRDKRFNAEINALTIEIIKNTLQERFAKVKENQISTFIEDVLRTEITTLDEKTQPIMADLCSMQTKYENLRSLQHFITKLINDLCVIESKE